MKLKNILFFFLMFTIFILNACGDDNDDGGESEDLNVRVIYIDDNVDITTTWTNGRDEGYATTVYVIQKWDFYIDNVTLNIESGVIIKFHPLSGPYMMMSHSGKVIANGTSDDPIIFTSYYDDTNGGDTNKDDNTTTPNAGDWYQVSTNSTQDSIFNHCHFYYGGNGSYKCTLDLFGSAATVTNCVFAHNLGGKDGDFYFGALDAGDASVGTIITGNRFYDNIIPLSIGYNYDIDNSNTFQNSDGTVKNVMNGIFINSSDNISKNLSWTETEVPFVIDDNDLWVNSGSILSLGNSVILKFCTGSALLLADGASALDQESNVHFTSFRDDTRCGDTNGDEGATSPSNGDWEGIYDDTAPLGGPYWFTWSNIHYRDITNF